MPLNEGTKKKSTVDKKNRICASKEGKKGKGVYQTN